MDGINDQGSGSQFWLHSRINWRMKKQNKTKTDGLHPSKTNQIQIPGVGPGVESIIKVPHERLMCSVTGESLL